MISMKQPGGGTSTAGPVTARERANPQAASGGRASPSRAPGPDRLTLDRLTGADAATKALTHL